MLDPNTIAAQADVALVMLLSAALALVVGLVIAGLMVLIGAARVPEWQRKARRRSRRAIDAGFRAGR